MDVISCFVPCDSKVISEIHEILILILTPQTSKTESFATIVNDLKMFTIDVYCCKTLYLRCCGNPGHVSTVKAVLTTLLIRLITRLTRFTRLFISFNILITASVPQCRPGASNVSCEKN